VRELVRFVVALVVWIVSFLVSWSLLSLVFLMLVNALSMMLHRAGILHGESGVASVIALPAILSLISSVILATYIAYRTSCTEVPSTAPHSDRPSDDAP